jgi:hypothetical protein
VVDDNENALEIIKRTLEGERFGVITCDGFQHAVALLEKLPFDIVIRKTLREKLKKTVADVCQDLMPNAVALSLTLYFMSRSPSSGPLPSIREQAARSRPKCRSTCSVPLVSPGIQPAGMPDGAVINLPPVTTLSRSPV